MAIDWRDREHPALVAWEKLAAPYEVKMTTPDHLQAGKELGDWYKSPEGKAAWSAYIQEREIKRVQCWIDHGLCPVYDSFNDNLCDVFPGFSWDTEGFLADMRALLANDKWRTLCGQLMEVRGWDMLKEVHLAIDEID